MNPVKKLHPGEILKIEYLDALGISAYRLANDLNIPQTRISQILKCRRRISADTALRLSEYFGTT
ncbi:MAG: HigA family addiction module antitoxin, partial [Saccharofermentanales bacterium]